MHKGVKSKKCQHYKQVGKSLKCQHYSQVGKKLEMSIFYISDQKFKIFNIMHKWLNMSTLYKSGL